MFSRFHVFALRCFNWLRLLNGLAVEAKFGPRYHFQPLDNDFSAATEALSVAVGLLVQGAQRIVDFVQQPSFHAPEQEFLLLFHSIGALVGEVERVSGQVAVATIISVELTQS